MQIQIHFFQSKPKWTTCKLRAKCLKSVESLQKCETLACNNMIHLSCSNQLLATFGEGEWEGPLFSGKCCFKHHKKSLESMTGKTQGRVPWYNDGPVTNINFMYILIDLLITGDNYNQWNGGYKNNGT